MLGGNDPSRREVLPFEAAIINGSSATFILRSSTQTTYDHFDWETALVCARDYDPELEMERDVIELPQGCRPYISQAIILKRSR